MSRDRLGGIEVGQDEECDGSRKDQADDAEKNLAFEYLCHMHHPLNTDNAPDVRGSGQREDEAGKENGRSCPFELTALAVVEVSGTQLDEEENGQNHVHSGKYNIIDHRLDLTGRRVPSILHGASHIAGTCGKSCGSHYTTQHQNDGEHGEILLALDHGSYHPF